MKIVITLAAIQIAFALTFSAVIQYKEFQLTTQYMQEEP